MKRILAMILTIIMILSLFPTSTFAADDNSIILMEEIVVSGNDDTSRVEIEVSATNFNVTVPINLPITIDSYGNAVAADDARIINNSYGPVYISNVKIASISDWNTVDYDTFNTQTEKVDSKNIGLEIRSDKTTGSDSNTFTQRYWPSIAGTNDSDSDELTISYSAKVSPQSEKMTDVHAIDVVFTIDWDLGDNVATESELMLTLGDIIPEGGVYYVGVTSNDLGNYSYASAPGGMLMDDLIMTIDDVVTPEVSSSIAYVAGENMPSTVNKGDVFVLGDYEYRYGYSYNGDGVWEENTLHSGWGVAAFDNTKSAYEEVYSVVNGQDVSNMDYAFYNCEALTIAPTIPDTVISMNNTFSNCAKLTRVNIDATPLFYDNCFLNSGITVITGTTTICDELLATKTDSSEGDSEEEKEEVEEGEHVVPEGAVYYVGVTSTSAGKYTGDTVTVYNAGDAMPASVNNGDVFVCGDYEYRYNYHYDNLLSGAAFLGGWSLSLDQDGWGVRVIDSTKAEYGEICASINGVNITTLSNAFRNCDLTNAPTIPNSVTDMSHAFRGCVYLTEAPTIPDKVENMCGTFRNCSKMTIGPTEIPDSVTNMEEAFAYCSYMETAPIISNNVTNLTKTFYSCYALTTAPDIPSGVTELNNTFGCCIDLKTAPVIPDSVTNMYYTFYKCFKMTDVPKLSNNLKNVDGAFQYCIALETLPEMPDTLTSMSGTFKDCAALSSVPALPNGLTIMASTFDGCTGLTVAPKIPNTVTNITLAFHRCTALTSAPEIPDSVTDMSGAFSGCTGLMTAPEIPGSIMSIDRAFKNCTSLTVAPAIPDSVTNMDYAFAGCTSLSNNIAIPDSVTSMIGTFQGCTFATAPTLPDGVVNIRSTFRDCALLTTTPSIPESVVYMNGTFANCTALTAPPVIPSNVVNMSGTFSGCTNLVFTPTIPNKVTDLSGAFEYCISLTVAPVVPSSVTNVNNTFGGCTKLTGSIEVNCEPEHYEYFILNTDISEITGSTTMAEELLATK